MSRAITLLVGGLFLIFLNVTAVSAAGPKFKEYLVDGGNKHNLSSANTGTGVTYKAQDSGDLNGRDKQVCNFCHTPHNSAPQSVLWNRKDPTTTFGHYSSTTLVIDNPTVRNTKSFYGEPNGSSRLCLSCHDGVTALGDVLTGPPIDFGLNSVITGATVYNAQSHHPVSFVYDSTVAGEINSVKNPGQVYTTPPTLPNVKLDKQNRMQCTACHDPHQNQTNDASTPFWIVGSGVPNAHDAVCLACHNFVSPNL